MHIDGVIKVSFDPYLNPLKQYISFTSWSLSVKVL